jgi:hypothetical protein
MVINKLKLTVAARTLEEQANVDMSASSELTAADQVA